MKHTRKIFGALLILALASLVVWLPADMVGVGSQPAVRSASKANAQAPVQQRAPEFDRFVSEPVTPSVTLAAADLPAAKPEYWLDREINPRMSYNSVVDPNFNPAGGPDPLLVVQESAPAAQPNAFGTPLLNFNGQGYTGVNPPDTVGDVGPNHYIQMINGGGWRTRADLQQGDRRADRQPVCLERPGNQRSVSIWPGRSDRALRQAG